MGKYTLHTDPRVDAIVESHLAQICECTLRHFRPEALLLSGSFGRGEGSVSLDGGQVRFYSDYEVSLISSRPSARLAIDPIQREINAKLPLSVSIFWTTPRKLRHNLSRNLSFGPPNLSIGVYELKAGSQVFYGDFDLSVNQDDPRDLPVNEGVRLIANRMMEAIEKWWRTPKSPDLGTRTPKSPDLGTQTPKSGDFGLRGRSELAFSLSKLVLACGDALLVKNGLYHYSYAERGRRFSRYYDELFKPLLGSEFLPLYEKASSFKLRPDAEVRPAAILEALPQIRACCWTILRHLLDLPEGNHDRVFEAMAASIPITYQTGLTKSLDVAYEDLILWLRGRRAGKKTWPNNRKPGPNLSMFQRLYGAIPSLFWGLPMEGRADACLLQTSREWGAWAFPPQAEAVPEEQLVSVLLSLWHALG
ncbi:MAG: hypothetical protein AB1846_11020 [Chloroflexota bacterium]